MSAGAPFQYRDHDAWPPGVWHAVRIDSTNAEALRRDASTFSDGACFVADEQTAGRGRLGRSWISDARHGLAFSLAYCHTDATQLLWTHVAAALSVIEAVEQLADRTIDGLGLKWPNDVVMVTAEPVGGIVWRKLCGVLTEGTAEPAEPAGRGQRVAIGVGVNVNHEPDDFPAELRETATSIRQVTGLVDEHNRPHVLSLILAALHRRLHPADRADAADAIRAEASERSVITGLEVDVSQPDGTIVRGRVAGIDVDGRLLLDGVDAHAGTRVVLPTGDVTHLRLAGR